MSLSQFLLILTARRKLILVTLGVILLAVLAISLITPKTFKATSTVVLNPGIDPVTGQALPGQLVPSYLATQIGVLHSTGLALKVTRELQLQQRPLFREQFNAAGQPGADPVEWVAQRLLKNMAAKPARESNVIDVQYADRDPKWAADIANGFTRMYQQMNMELRLDPAQKAAGYFEQQIRAQRAELEAAQQRMSRYQKEKGIANVDEKLDVEGLRLKEMTTQLVTVQNQMMEAESRQVQARGEGGADSVDVLANPMIQNLRVALATAETKYAQVAEKFTENHPRYLEARAEVARLRSELRTNSRSASSGLTRSAAAYRQREAELASGLAKQKNVVLALNQARDELMILAREADSHQKAYELLLQKRGQAVVEGQSKQSEVTILNTATAPLKPSSPILLLNLVIATIAGLLLGIGLAMLAEMRDRRIRSTDDVADVLDAPVLGSIHWGPPSRTRIRGPQWLLPRPAAPG